MNILTVAFRGDLANLLYQAHGFKKNWLGEKKWYIVIEDYNNDPYGTVTEQWCYEYIKPILPDWDITIIKGPEIVCQRGWERQQIYKLWAAAELVSSEYTLVMDGKNFIVRPIDQSYFFTDQQELKVLVHNVPVGTSSQLPPAANPIGDEEWLKCCSFFGESNLTKVRPQNITPWVWRKDLAQHTIKTFQNYGCDIYTTASLPVHEFESYWLLNQDKIKWVSGDLIDGVMCSGIVDMDSGKERLNMHIEFKKPFWVFHRHAYQFDKMKNVNFSNDYLKELGVIDDGLIQKWIETMDYIIKTWPNVV